MLKQKRSTARLKRVCRRYAGDRDGAAAIEFAIVAPVFLALMFSIFEVGWFYFVNATVDGAASAAARVMRTGQADGVSSGEFFLLITCPRLEVLGNCPERATVEVKKYDSFALLAADSDAEFVCRDDDQTALDNIAYDTSEELGIYRIRVCFLYDTLNPAIGMNLAQNSLGQRRVTATYILRAEPYAKASTAD